MPFIYRRKPIAELKAYKYLAIRGDGEIDGLVRKTIQEIEDFGSDAPYALSGVLYIPILFKIPDFNDKPKERCLVTHCQTLGLNILEVQSWLDNWDNYKDGINWLESASICDFDERQMLFMVNAFQTHGGHPSATLCHRLN